MADCSLDPHVVLGVTVGASTDAVRTAYKRAALESHPDKGGSKEAFQRVALAFEQLCGLRGDWQKEATADASASKRETPPTPRGQRGRPRKSKTRTRSRGHSSGPRGKQQ
eukprot:5845048-Amphidinium_carterae.1